MMRWCATSLLLAALPTLADDSVFRPEWTATCNYGGASFTIQFKSKSGDPTEDDQLVAVRWTNGNVINLPVSPALFVPAQFVTDAKNYCKDIGAFDWPGGRLLLLVPRNDRPSYDRIVAVVIDAKTGSFVQSEDDLGAYWKHIQILKQGSGYRALLDRTWHQDANDFGEFSAPDWMRLYNERGHLVHKWEIERR